MAGAVPLIMVGLSAASSISGGIRAGNNADAEGVFLRRVGQVEAADKRRETRRLIASQRVAFGASGVDPSVGSPMDVLGDTVAESELAALRIKFAREQGTLSIEQRGDQAQQAGIVNGVGTVLGGVASFVNTQEQLKLERLRALGRTNP